MRTSESTDKLAEALAAAQGEFKNPERNREVKVQTKTGGSYTFAYATLDAIMDAIRGPLSKHGLAMLQDSGTADGALTLCTRLIHSSGQWIESDTIAAKPADFGPQALGSLMTYLRRYSICGLLGIAPDEDDDGNRASGNEVAMAKAKPRPATKGKPDPHTTPPAADMHPARSTFQIMEDKVLQYAGNDERLQEMAEWIETEKCNMTREEKDRIGAKIVRARKALEAVAEPALRH